MLDTSQIETHTLSVLVDNEPVLARVVGLFSGRGYNIESLTVSEVDNEKTSRISVVTSGTPMVIEQIKKLLERQVPVHQVRDLTLTVAHVERELALVKIINSEIGGLKLCEWQIVFVPVRLTAHWTVCL